LYEEDCAGNDEASVGVGRGEGEGRQEEEEEEEEEETEGGVLLLCSGVC
jgi:hypothetical protein